MGRGEALSAGTTHLVTVLHTVRSLRIDGVVKVILRNLQYLDRERFRHVVCSMRPDEGLADEYRAHGFEPFFAGYRGPVDAPRAIHRIRALIRRLGVDVVHANRTLDLTLAGTAAKLERVRVISSLHWLGRIEDHPEDPTPAWRQRIKRGTQVRLNRMLAGRIVAVSDAVRDSFAGMPGFPSERVEVVYPGIALDGPEPAPGTRDRVRRALGLAETVPVLLNVGRLHPVKGQEQLVEVMRRVRLQVPDAVLLIAGDGELEAALRRRIGESGMADAVRLLGARSDVDELLLASDALALVSESEAAPLPLFEAMRARRPVVATAVGGVREIVVHGETGWLVERGDAAGLTGAIVRLLADPEARVRMGEAGRRRAEERFDIRLSVRALERLYAS